MSHLGDAILREKNGITMRVRVVTVMLQWLQPWNFASEVSVIVDILAYATI